jgi:CheY-like chemotaxis protein
VTIGRQPGTVTRFQPLRVLLAGRDRRYLRVTSFLLEQRGYVVRSSNPDDAADAAHRHRADVVLLEGDRLRTEAARRAAATVALNPNTGVILMVDAPPPGPTGLTMLRKWADLDELVDEIETAATRTDGVTVLPAEDGAA